MMRLLPHGPRRLVRLMRNMSWTQRKMFLVRRTKRILTRRMDDKRVRQTATPKHILFICHGNIMRSPYAAASLAHIAQNNGAGPTVQIKSAGLFAPPGRSADHRARRLAAMRGFSLESHTSTPVTPDLVGWADIILVMDAYNEVELSLRHPDALPKLALLGDFGRLRDEPVDIDDPYPEAEEDVAVIFARIDRAIALLWNDVRDPGSGTGALRH
jgi:protein-tyrosine phosphatase